MPVIATLTARCRHFLRNLFRRDPQAQHALTLFDEAEALLRLSAGSGRVASR